MAGSYTGHIARQVPRTLASNPYGLGVGRSVACSSHCFIFWWFRVSLSLWRWGLHTLHSRLLILEGGVLGRKLALPAAMCRDVGRDPMTSSSVKWAKVSSASSSLSIFYTTVSTLLGANGTLCDSERTVSVCWGQQVETCCRYKERETFLETKTSSTHTGYVFSERLQTITTRSLWVIVSNSCKVFVGDCKQ